MSSAADQTTIVDNHAPITTEANTDDLPVRGELPPGLCGTLYRNGPNPRFPNPHAHWFTGDGMVHAIRIADGRVSYANRWVRTARFTAEEAAGKALFGGSGFADGGPPGLDSGTANTNIVWHAGRLLALEEAHLPVRIDPVTLATLGPETFGSALRGPFTAHPKIDPVTGELIFFAYGANGRLSAGMSWGRITPEGRVTQFERFEAPYAAMVHNFVVTARHMLFPILPLTASVTRARNGGPPFAWEPARGAALGVLPRAGSATDLRWFRAEPRFVYHVMNGWEEGDRIHADVMEAEEAPLFPRADGTRPDPAKSQARLTRWTLDLNAKTDAFTAAQLDELVGEFPRSDDRFAGRPYRHGWFDCIRPGTTQRRGFDGIAHVDFATGGRDVFFFGDGDMPSEPLFAPRSPGAAEADGWLLAVVWRAARRTSELVVLNATDIGSGPVATVTLPQRVPVGFHGNWVAS